jgi:hypothetical protein
MDTFLITCVVIALLIAGGIAISVHLHKPLIRGQREVGSQRFYATPRRYATDLANVGMNYSQRAIVTTTVALVALSMLAIVAVINALAR